MPSPTVVSLSGFPAQLQLTRQGNFKVSPTTNQSNANVRAPLGGKVITRFSLAGTNLTFANGSQEIQDSRDFAPDSSQLVPLLNWSVQCPLTTTPNPLLGLNVTAEYLNNPPSAAKTAPIVIIDAPPLATEVVEMAKEMIVKGVTAISDALSKRTGKKTARKRGAKKRTVKKSAAKSSSPRKASSKKSAAKRPAKKSDRKSPSKRRQ